MVSKLRRRKILLPLPELCPSYSLVGIVTAVVTAATVLNIFYTSESGSPFQEMALHEISNAFAGPVTYQLPLRLCK